MTWSLVAALTILGLLGIWPAQQYLGDASFYFLLFAVVIATIQAISGRRAAS